MTAILKGGRFEGPVGNSNHRGGEDEAAVDGGEVDRFCLTCAFSGVCGAVGYGEVDLQALHGLVEHVGPFRAGDYVFRTGDPFRAICAVRRGTVKTSRVDKDGREQVLGFYLPGEVIGLNAIYPDKFTCNAVALETTYFCRFAFSAMSTLATRMPLVQQHLFRMISRELGSNSLLVGDYSADERMAAFLIDLGERHAVRGQSATKFQLSMSRSDIGNYLHLAAETVSRVLSRFRGQGLMQIDGRAVTICLPADLRAIGCNLLSQ
jgi:CRP/FNR family transcriptional regulator